MTSTENKNHITTTPQALESEFASNAWEQRLAKCVEQRCDSDLEFAPDARHYRKQMLKEYYEGTVLVAFIIEYVNHDGTSQRVIKMLLIDSVRHIVP